MRVKVIYFGMLRDLAGRSEETLDLPDGTGTGALFAGIRHRFPELDRFANSLALAVNLEYVTRERELRDGDEVALIPPVSGGAPSRCAVVTEAIDAAATVQALKAGEDGAVVVFDGIVRNNSRGRRTLYLEYEAYVPMALREMESLAAQALQKFAIRDLRIVHRIGRLDIGETSVLIAVVSAHRAAAFDACRWLIDTLKKQVPIWKKEFFEDGAVWADGEPFPAPLTSR